MVTSVHLFVHRNLSYRKSCPRYSTLTPQSGTPPTYQAVDDRILLNHCRRLLKVCSQAQYLRRRIYQIRSRPIPRIQTSLTRTTTRSSLSMSKKYTVSSCFRIHGSPLQTPTPCYAYLKDTVITLSMECSADTYRPHFAYL